MGYSREFYFTRWGLEIPSEGEWGNNQGLIIVFMPFVKDGEISKSGFDFKKKKILILYLKYTAILLFYS